MTSAGPGSFTRVEAALKAKGGLILPATVMFTPLTLDVPKHSKQRYKTFPPNRETQHAPDMSDVKVMMMVSVDLCQCFSITRGMVAVRTSCGQCSPAPTDLGGCLNEATCTGSYSTRRGGRITSGCPGSSPHTPESQKEEESKEASFLRGDGFSSKGYRAH